MPFQDAQKQLSGLILCEERSFGHYLKHALESAGYPPASVSNSAHDALTRFIRNRFDFAVISSALKQPCACDVIRSIRCGDTQAPRDLVILLVQTGETEDPAERIHMGMLGINAFLEWPASIHALQNAVAEAISHHHLALDAIDAIDAGGDDSNHDTSTPACYSGEVFSLPAGALVESMYLVDPVTIHGRILVDAGTILGAAHIRALESLQLVLENQDIRVRFKCGD